MWKKFVTYVHGNASAISMVSSTSTGTLSNLGVVKGEGLHLCEGLGVGFVNSRYLWQSCHVHGVFLLTRRRRNVVHIPGGARRKGLN